MMRAIRYVVARKRDRRSADASRAPKNAGAITGTGIVVVLRSFRPEPLREAAA